MKVYLETYGCTTNKGDTQLMAGLLAEEFEIVDRDGDCQVAVINSCGVIGRTQRKVLKRIKELTGAGKVVILTGCLPGIDPEASAGSGASALLGTRDLGEINEAVRAVLEGRTFIRKENTWTIKPSMPKFRDGVTAVVTISEGCLGRCTYCGTRKARGILRSFPRGAIVGEVRRCIAGGSREIQLTSQDTGVYGMDAGERLPELLRAVSDIAEDFRVRVGMMNPGHIRDITDEVVDAFRSKKIYKFLHLPVQSGDDGVLEDMKRGYTVDDFRGIVAAFRKEFPDMTLSTDVLVGYPIEDENAFEETFRLVEEIRPQVLNITRFSSRPGTAAAELKDMPDRFKKERTRRLTDLYDRMSGEENQRWIGREVSALVNEPGRDCTMLARTDDYKLVALPGGRLGERVTVEITDATATYLMGRTV